MNTVDTGKLYKQMKGACMPPPSFVWNKTNFVCEHSLMLL